MSSSRAFAPAQRVCYALKSWNGSTVMPATFARNITTDTMSAPLESQRHIEAQLTSDSSTFPVQNEGQSSITNLQTSSQHQHNTSRAHLNPFIQTATITTHAFPSLEPVSYATYPSTHILVPLRKDILHRAVVFEGDSTRQGTASTKWRSEVHGSNRKVRPQKGSGMARLGDKKSPMLRGGGVAFGPKPRDFSTDLPRKVYDLAWRIALSYRYRRGELLVLESEAEIDCPESTRERYVQELLRWHKMDREHRRALFVASDRRTAFFETMETERLSRQSRALTVDEVDVKDLLELGKVVIEKEALERLLGEHQSDLGPSEKLGAWQRMFNS